MRILVADNDAEHRGKLVVVLQLLNHEIQEALSVRDVQDICRSKCPDLIFVDSKLSGVSGFEVVKQIRNLGGGAVWVPIILMSKTLNPQEIETGMEVGFDDFLKKPIEPLQAKIKVNSALRLKNLKEEVFSIAHDLVVSNRVLESMVTHDVLTGVGNVNSFEDALERDWFQAKRTQSSLALLLIDIDYFQLFNQNYGASEGDKCIKLISETLRTLIPMKADASLSRISGATFAVLLPNTSIEEGQIFAEKCRASIESLQIPHKGSGCSEFVTVSVGVSLAEQGNYTSPWDLKEAADFALYQAKHFGRNRVSVEMNAKTKA